MQKPLAERLRPQTLDDYVGQQHLVGADGYLRHAITSGQIPSMVFWGPPGTGKTTLAMIVAAASDRPFFALSAVDSGVKQVREVLQKARASDFFDRPSPILFIDEIHRFNKSQQDSLLKAVERGTVVLIGATTENPSFEVNSALLSRVQVFVLKSLEKEDLELLITKAISEDKWLATKQLNIKETRAILRISGGDARKLYSVMEILGTFAHKGQEITDEHVEKIITENLSLYDKSGEQHYDIISAFIKSVRGSDPNAAVYWLARMLDGGEDVKFIARRLIILASEDIGLANPNALLIASTTAQAVHTVGMPEARIILSQAAVYLAVSAKSNASYVAINKAMADARSEGNLPVPLHLRNAPTKLMKDLNYGADYVYSHDQPGHFSQQDYLPDAIKGKVYYSPADNPAEGRFRELLKKLWKGVYGY